MTDPYSWPIHFLDQLRRLWSGVPEHAERATSLPEITEGKVQRVEGPSRYPADVPGFVVSPAELEALVRAHDGQAGPDDRDLIDGVLDRFNQLRGVR